MLDRLRRPSCTFSEHSKWKWSYNVITYLGVVFQKVQADPTLKIEFPDIFEPPKKKLTLEIDCAKFTDDDGGAPIDFNNNGE